MTTYEETLIKPTAHELADLIQRMWELSYELETLRAEAEGCAVRGRALMRALAEERST